MNRIYAYVNTTGLRRAFPAGGAGKIFRFFEELPGGVSLGYMSDGMGVRPAAGSRRGWCDGVGSMTKEQFSALVLEYERLVYTICFQLVRDAAAAEDLTQDTFLSAYLHRDSIPEGYERQWLGRVASNKAKDHLQSAWSRRTVFPGDGETFSRGLAPPAEEVALRRSAAGEVREAVQHMKEPYRQVCRLCLLEERSVEETALALGRPVKTVYTQLSRGKRLLREELERGGKQDGIS